MNNGFNWRNGKVEIVDSGSLEKGAIGSMSFVELGWIYDQASRSPQRAGHSGWYRDTFAREENPPLISPSKASVQKQESRPCGPGKVPTEQGDSHPLPA